MNVFELPHRRIHPFLRTIDIAGIPSVVVADFSFDIDGVVASVLLTLFAGISKYYKGMIVMNSILTRLHTFFWYPLTILTGILAGFMISHSIMLGRFFNWYITSGNEVLLRETFTVFRVQSNANAMYDIPLYVAFIIGIIWTIVSFVIKKDRIIALIAGLSTLWVGMIFMISDLDEAEEAVLSSAGNADLTQLFLNINIPIHSTFAVIYLVSFILLLWCGMRAKKLRESNDCEC